jgi:peptidoglycan hydrolase CwlO-like protein
MLTLINLLIIIFILLISYQIFLANFSNNIIEGLEDYQEYDTKNPDNVMILVQQNSGNIEVLRKQFDNISGLNQEVQDISGNVANLTKQVDDLVKAQEDYLAEKLPEEPPEITGTEEEEEEPEEPDI